MQKNKTIAIIVLAGIAVVVLAVYFLGTGGTPSIQVIAPASGDVLTRGSVYQIQWNTNNISASNKISVAIWRIPPPPLQEEGQEFDPIVFIDLENTGSQDWTVSDMYPDGNYVLGITSYTSVPITESVSAESAQFRIEGKAAGGGTGALQCHDSPKYFAVEKSLADSVGSDILIKYKTEPSQNIPCAYTPVSGDLELKNVMAEYFLTFTDNFLVLDKGTAPEPRGLVVYDLRTREMVFTDSYAKPVEVVGDSITYWSKTDQKPTIQNCPNLAEYTGYGLGAVVMSKVTVDLSSRIKSDLGVFECIAVQ
jgi:hypothetical protein